MNIEKISDILKAGINKKIASAISLGVLKNNKEYFFHEVDSNVIDLRLNNETLYDLASLTKIIGTTAFFMKEISENRLALENPILASYPKVSLKEVLSHQAGFPAHERYYEDPGIKNVKDFAESKSKILQKVFHITLCQKREKLYSDLGFIALGGYLEREYQKSVGEIFNQFFQSFGYHFSWFKSSFLKSNTEMNVVPTAYCPIRKRLLKGEVHDLNCYFLGGVFTHAGLFGSIQECLNVGRFFLKTLSSAKNKAGKTIQEFAHLGIGFDKPKKNGSVAVLSPESFGHFGYTGTSLWCDPKREMVVVLLSNRVFYSCDAEPIFWLRKNIHDAIME